MDVNHKSHARRKRWKKHASRRDYKYGGKIGGHSVKRLENHRYDAYEYICDEAVRVTSCSEQDRRLQEAGIKLPLEEKLGFSLKKANRVNFSKMEQVKEALGEMCSTVTAPTLENDSGWGYTGMHTVKKTWYAMPAQNLDTNGIVAHVQQKKEQELRKLLREFGMDTKREHVAERVRLTRFLPHGEISSAYVPYVVDPKTGKRFGECIIEFKSPMKVVGIGFRAITCKYKTGTRIKKKVTVGPVTAKVGFRTFDSKVPEGEFTGTTICDGPRSRSFYRGPRNGTNEISHKIDISNCQSLKIEARHLTTWVGSLSDIPDYTGRYSTVYCFEVFVYGSPEKRAVEEEADFEVREGSGVIKNQDEVQGKVTVICLQEAETVNRNWTLCSHGYRHYRRFNDDGGVKIHTDEDFVIRGQQSG